MSTEIETLEQEARRLRDAIYGPLDNEQSWLNMRSAWMADIEWLRARQPAQPPDAKPQTQSPTPPPPYVGGYDS